MAAHQNRLASSSSPYLLQHADNPVDWYPWGTEALEKAKREDKPILLSIGYAACHWCHVMEHESFENEDTARLMNELFVNIKVDREERPDLDQIYQLVVQLMGRNGGWPLTVFLTPDQRPFFAGTYFPPADRYGMPGFPKVLNALADAYKNQRGEVAEQAEEITNAIARVGQTHKGAGTIDQEVLGTATRKLVARFDDRNGGFGSRPKFPNTMALDVLLRRGALEGDRVAKDSVELALDRMRAGGIWDQLRGGFHRYSTDERWLVPHFEKMLYDNALLLRLYADGYRVYGKEVYAETARALVAYLFAEMRDDAHGGAFFASQDADSEGHEGKFFVFTPTDLKAAVAGNQRLYDVAAQYFGITEEGNFEESGATVLSEARTLDRVAATLDLKLPEARAALAEASRLMLAYREKRPRPLRDDKVLASWNGLMIGALAEAGRAFGEPSWVKASAGAFAALERGLIRDGRVGRYLKDGKPASAAPGFLDDHAYMGNAALDLYEATGDARYVSVAHAIAKAMVEHHADEAEGGFWFAPADGEALIARTKDAFDQAIPSGASMAALLCLRLGTLVDEGLTAPGEKQLELSAGSALENPFGMGQAVLGIDRLAHGSTDIVVVGPRDQAEALVAAAYRVYLPNRTIAWVDPSDAASVAATRVLAADKPAHAGKAVAYVCRGRACSAPVSDAAALEAMLREGEKRAADAG
ncbi:Thymidylate kinase [Minicystis rosea]|nr:Thymidylate kinase [Minicystis rosea]